MGRFLLRRIGLALVTLWLLSVIVFVVCEVIPGDVARSILGSTAAPESVEALNEELGTDRPALVRYGDWIGGVVRGDLGESYALGRPVDELVGKALANSAKLALLAFLLVVPLGILGGVVAALHEGRALDRVISVGGLSISAIPEFVWAVTVIMVFGIWLDVLPVSALAPPGSGLLTQVEYLILPALCLVLVLFGYLARMSRAGTVEALAADYTRTAVLKGLPRRTVIRRHVLRNALLPTIAVVATQTGYLIGGLVAIELIFNYPGIGRLIVDAAEVNDFPLLEGAVLTVGVVYLLATLVADLVYAWLNPRLRFGGASA
jgi:peptide/nickel transport system permease protein